MSIVSKRRGEKGMREESFFCNNYPSFHFVLYDFISSMERGLRSVVEFILLAARKSRVQDTYFHQMPFKSLTIQKRMSEKFQLLLSFSFFPSTVNPQISASAQISFPLE